MAKKNLLKSLISISGLTVFSRILGFIRDMLIAKYFGAGALTDAFNVAFKLPNLLRRIFAEQAFATSFVPILSEFKTTRTILETQKFVAAVAGLMGLILLITTLIGMIFALNVIVITAPGFIHNPDQLKLSMSLLRITFPYLFFISLASLLSSVLITWRHFAVASFTPSFLNLSFIIFILFFRNYFNPNITVLAWATLAGGIIQLLFQLPFLKKINMMILPILDLKNKAVWRVLRLMGPAIFAVSIYQISLIINTIYASYLPSGSISWIYYADRLMEFPSGIFGVGLSVILLPSLSRHVAMKNQQEFSRLLDWGIRFCLLMALPATMGLIMCAQEIIMTLFMYGKFSYYDVIETQKALIGYSIGLVAIILVRVLAPGFYANQNVKTPVKIAIFVLICTQVFNLILVDPLKHAGLTLSISLASWINALNLIYCLIQKKIYQPQPYWRIFLIKLTAATVFMVVNLKLGKFFIHLNFTGSLGVRIISLTVLLGIAISSYLIALWLLKFKINDLVYKE